MFGDRNFSDPLFVSPLSLLLRFYGGLPLFSATDNNAALLKITYKTDISLV